MPSFKLLEAAAAEPSFLQVVAMGLITVFVVLICLIIIIKVMGAIMAGAGKAAPAPAPAAPAAAAPAAAAAAPQPNKQQLVAAISAAIAEDMGGSVDHIRIHSIRKL
ncbi:OadG family protein [Acutalibacter muris]|jgi:sodium pump decarboxylase gamma subunit|uniref:OadG family protein n=1 Tax=Acutalibacter muris TaxID=1796620 RepID=A0A1Z2XMC2_9FIRM|nr:OadG family transporter subunit [Acutalibacter muris]ANU53751.1 hypothetical protein A4V00_06755 [Hungateiclostridiaceae bacterium KB18]ASB39575.1 hypothetical protein ADH66_02210 [Acutalibacter muris]MCI9192630.1 hypothetical protein [Acutalibacter muris]QQR28866.1 OadG family protein [Acutalibacter muris]